MSFITRAFTPPGSGAYVPQTQTVTAATEAPPPPPPPPPPPGLQAQAQSFVPGTQASGARANIGAGAQTFLGAAAAAGQTSKTKVTLA